MLPHCCASKQMQVLSSASPQGDPLQISSLIYMQCRNLQPSLCLAEASSASANTYLQMGRPAVLPQGSTTCVEAFGNVCTCEDMTTPSRMRSLACDLAGFEAIETGCYCRVSPEVQADAFEALVGAIYLDRGLQMATRFLTRIAEV